MFLRIELSLFCFTVKWNKWNKRNILIITGNYLFKFCLLYLKYYFRVNVCK
jgi:hypothetical protein